MNLRQSMRIFFQKPEIMKKQVIVTGPFRSGTNLMKHMIETNTNNEVVFSQLWWKHMPIPTLPRYDGALQDSRIIIMTKDPVAWTQSLHKFYLDRRRNENVADCYSKFIRSRIFVYDNSRGSLSPKSMFRTPLDYFNNFYYSYISVSEGLNFNFTKLEDLLRNPAQVLADISLDEGIEEAAVGIPDLAVLPSGDGRKARLGKSPPGAYPKPAAEDVEFIYSILDKELISNIGYGGC